MIFKPIYILAKEELNAGEFAELSISTKIMPIDAEIRLINAKTREEISASNENINKEYYTIKLKIPENTASDKYFIEISSKYKEIVSDTSYLITVTSTITEPEKGKCPSCDDGNKCTEDICSKETFYECEYKKILPCCGDKICSLNENCPEECKKASSLIKPEPQKSNEAQEIMNNLDLVKKMSLSNKEAAMKICNDMVLTSAKDQCYLNIVMNNPDVSICGQISNSAIYDSCYNMIAQDSGDPVFCEKSIDSDNRDTCLFTFTSREDFTVCEKILDPTRRNICNSLKEYRTLSG